MLTFSFNENSKAAKHFLTWLCESGEQNFWAYMETQEEDHDDPDITITSFDYDWVNCEVLCSTGRLDDNHDLEDSFQFDV